MTPFEEFIGILRQPGGAPSAELLQQLRQAYPFFALPAAIALKSGGSMLSGNESERLKATVALNSSDASMLYRLTGTFGPEFADFYGEARVEPQAPDTDSAIDTFLDRYASGIDPEETALLERLIFNPVPDYASQLAATETAAESTAETSAEPDSSPDTIADISRIVDSITDIPSESPQTPETTAPPQQTEKPRHSAFGQPRADTTFSESLAKIYVKQRRYDKALEIISHLRLKYPEKSCYFADQMRFLQKLILNSNHNIK